MVFRHVDQARIESKSCREDVIAPNKEAHFSGVVSLTTVAIRAH